MARIKDKQRPAKKELNTGAWTAEEDRKLAEAIEINGPKQWTTITAKSGLNRCAKSCRLRWMNYLRPNIKRGNMSDQEEDLIIRLHKLLGNRWSLIAARLPGRTDNEIKNYWNSHLSKKKFEKEGLIAGISTKNWDPRLIRKLEKRTKQVVVVVVIWTWKKLCLMWMTSLISPMRNLQLWSGLPNSLNLVMLKFVLSRDLV
ncbi:hypothetical protein BUALT_Bualt07G0163100 [Buddleja alternifolia]|uniref:Uncharacterized protein n=1 Tax=Buddleja alternifolia TaxID=168488 RepID=A0AAV6XM51_9LAMI|nr:hypothetical protein BUALT_Bualt07G0163100 [Buddleja alternifolia]